MKMLLQHQKRRTLPSGRSIPTGEDGKPYADGGILIVADGLGGRGGFPHTKINPKCFDPQAFYGEVLASSFPEADEDFKSFVTESFAELFALKDIYFGEESGAKKASGYFASRLVTASVLYALKFDKQFGKDELFAELKKLEGDGEKVQEHLNGYAGRLAAVIAQNLAAFAADMGLEFESKIKGSYLLPTTLTVTLTEEEEGQVNAVYLWAGDSRGYLWNADGLAQITDDHESGETMTNLITLTKPFSLEARAVSFKKPCLLLNTTDGIYKCNIFASPFDLEYVLIDAFNSSESFGQAAEKLDGIYGSIGYHDDSNTVALLSYGYADYASVKADVKRRLNYINTEIVAKLPDILERDYAAELDDIEKKMQYAAYAFKDRMTLTEDVKEFVRDYIVRTGYAPYESARKEVSARMAGFCEVQTKQKNLIRGWVKRNWLTGACLRRSLYEKQKFADRRNPYEYCSGKAEILKSARGEYRLRCGEILNSYDEAVGGIEGLRGYITNLNLVSKGEEEGELLANIKKLQKALDELKAAVNTRSKFLVGYKNVHDDIEGFVKLYHEHDAEIINSLITKIVEGDPVLDGVSMKEDSRAEINSYIETLRQAIKEGEELSATAAGLAEGFVTSAWDEKRDDIIARIWEERPDLLPADLREQISLSMADYKAKHQQLLERMALRDSLYGEYYKNYVRFFKESAL